MAFSHGRVAVFKIDDSGGTQRDLSAYLDNVDFPQEVDIPETSVFGDTARGYDVVGLKSASFSLSGKFDSTATSGPDVVLQGLIGLAASDDFEYGPEGGTTGKIKYSGKCRITSYRITSAVNGVVSFSADGVVDGAVTRGTFA